MTARDCILPLTMLTGAASAAPSDHWAVLVAGSKGFGNYRHQSDTCHAYQILKRNGVPENQIIHIAFDDIADHKANPFPGKIFNARESVAKPIRKFIDRCEAIKNVEMPLQHKLLMLTHCAKSLAYFYMSSAPEFTLPYAAAIKEVQMRTLTHLLNVSTVPKNTWSQVVCPFSSVGLGLMDGSKAQVLFDAGTQKLTEQSRPQTATEIQPAKKTDPLTSEDSPYVKAVHHQWRKGETRPSRRWKHFEQKRNPVGIIPAQKALSITCKGIRLHLWMKFGIDQGNLGRCSGEDREGVPPEDADHNESDDGDDDTDDDESEEEESTQEEPAPKKRRRTCRAPAGTIDHCMACTRCCGWRTKRHNAVCRALETSSNFYCAGLDQKVAKFLHLDELTRWKRGKKIPDLFAIREGDRNEGKVLFLDVAITHPPNDPQTNSAKHASPMQGRYNHKGPCTRTATPKSIYLALVRSTQPCHPRPTLSLSSNTPIISHFRHIRACPRTTLARSARRARTT